MFLNAVGNWNLVETEMRDLGVKTKFFINRGHIFYLIVKYLCKFQADGNLQFSFISFGKISGVHKDVE